MSGKKPYEPSSRRVSNTVDNGKKDMTSYRRLSYIRDIWTASSIYWREDGRKKEFKIIIPDEQEEITFRTHKRSDGKYIVECETYRWVE